MYGSADSLEHWAENTMTLQVDPDRMLVTARGFEAVADKIRNWVFLNADGLSFPPMGGDAVSIHIAGVVKQSAENLVEVLNQAEFNVRETAASLRTQAAAYGYTDDVNAQDLRG